MSSKNGPKIVLFDLETMPDMDRAFAQWTTLSRWYGTTLSADLQSIICFGYKVFGSKSAKVKHAWDYEGWKTNVNDDKELCKEIYEVLKDADVVVTQNGRDFDWKVLQTRLLLHGLPPLPKILHIDTKVEAKRHLKLSSNSLNNMAKFLTEDKKMDNGGWDLWVEVRKRNPKAMRTMSLYCKKDVLVLEKVFEKMKPMIRGLPNSNLFHAEQCRCPNCGSLALQKRGWLITKLRKKQRMQCMDCGSWSSLGPKEQFPKEA